MYRPRFIISNKINNELLEIERARGFLDATQLKGDWIQEMQSAALILEAHHSTHIEGTQLTLSDAQKIFAGKHVEGVRPDDRQELMNYKEAMDFVSGYLDVQSKITEDVIKGIHKILVKDVRGGSLEPGCYRKVQNYVVNSVTGEIIYTPPSSEEVPMLMKEFMAEYRKGNFSSPYCRSGTTQVC